MEDSRPHGSTLIPSFRYRDANAAIDFLERALGFTRHAVYPGESNTVQHAELRHGSGMIMLGSASNPSPHPHLMAHPQDIGSRV
ncbi:MAG TPA: VOC family protein, partial [Acidobacteriaceae bacterium]|nr:VOC family protein [Acidobacteriaceae bacterium]